MPVLPSAISDSWEHGLARGSVGLLIWLLLLVGSACASVPLGGGRPHQVRCLGECGDPREHGDDFDWKNGGPLEFLEMLRDAEFSYPVHGVHVGWLRESDRAPLEAMLGSTEPCANVRSTRSSYYPLCLSTIGHEAAYLLEGLDRGVYPPALNSVSCE